jgi:hypothetical protein
MISLQFKNLNEIGYEIDRKYAGIAEIIGSNSRTQIAKAVFTITTKKFIKDFAIAAGADKKKYFHMYEWNNVGNPAKKLYTIRRTGVAGGNLRINIAYLKSKTPVPIDPRLLEPGKKGKSVTKKSVFKDMAEVMEEGKPVSFTTKQYIAFVLKGDDKIHFVGPGKTIINKNPGGRATTMAFDKFVVKWYATKVDPVILSSGMYDQIGKGVTIVLNNKKGGAVQAREAIRIVTEKYAQGVVEL